MHSWSSSLTIVDSLLRKLPGSQPTDLFATENMHILAGALQEPFVHMYVYSYLVILFSVESREQRA
jgi:hypothetical protein